MKRLTVLLLLTLILLSAGLPAHAQVGQQVQVWLVPGGADSPITVEYRDLYGQTIATYIMGVDSFIWSKQGGGRVFGFSTDAIPVFDPYQGTVIFYPVPGKGVSNDQQFYNLTETAPSPDGAQYAYGVMLQQADPQLPATNWVYLAVPGQYDDTPILQEQTESFLAIAPLGWSADGSTLLLHEMPQGIGGYILFWTYQNVRAYTVVTGETRPLGNLDGYSGDLAYTALVERGDAGPTGLLVTQAATGAQTRYLLPPLGEQPFVGGGAFFSPSNARVAYQVARGDPMNEKFWTIVVDLFSGESKVILEDQAVSAEAGVTYGNISAWLDDNTLVVGSQWSQQSAVVDVTTGTIIRQEPGSFLGTAMLSGDLAPAGTAFAQCPTAPPSRLQPFTNGRVTYTDGTMTNVRQSPGVSGQIVAQEPEGATFYIDGGPLCVDGYAWWHLGFQDGTYGYVAEGDLTAYYLEPWQ
jgi:hypothetical protein